MERIDTRRMLQVFHFIYQHGDKTPNGKILGGVEAESSFDGYTVSLFNDSARIDLLFHGRYQFSARNAYEKLKFLDCIKKIAGQMGEH